MGLTLADILSGILSEGVSEQDVLDAIKNRYYVRVRYDDGKSDGNTRKLGSRVIQPAAVGSTKKGNPVLRAFQLNGASKRGAPKWKFFLLDRISSWTPMKNKRFNSMPDGYNRNGDESMFPFKDNVKIDVGDGTLDRIRAARGDNSPKVSVRNVNGPVRADRQWKKNVFTSQPGSQKYSDIAKSLSDTVKGADYWSDYDKASNEADGNGIAQNNNGSISVNEPVGYDVSDTNFDESDFAPNTNKR